MLRLHLVTPDRSATERCCVTLRYVTNSYRGTSDEKHLKALLLLQINQQGYSAALQRRCGHLC